ncbi:MAG: AAA family ATPase [Bacteroidales bacterium]|nr:AAA family ATPase [Bacteroidales bacterium]
MKNTSDEYYYSDDKITSSKVSELNISAVTINQDLCNPKFKKVLSEWYYIFNDRVRVVENNRIELNPDYKDHFWYFGKKISVQAIVGPNGSGKSSLLELIYRIINNFCALLEMGMKRNAAWRLLFVEGLYAELYYVQDNHLYCISCRGNEVLFIRDGEKLRLLGVDIDTYSYIKRNDSGLLVKDMVKIADQLHYTIVTNYSLQSLVSVDYQDEKTLILDRNVFNYSEQEGTVWINHLYHKNDGYLTPLVLNPFRDQKGNIDIVKEHGLTIYRLSALLLYYRNRKGFFDEYVLNDIQYKFSLKLVYDKFELNEEHINKDPLNIENFIKSYPHSVPSVILKQFKLCDLKLDNDIARAGAIYIIYKVLSIASKYPSYNYFEGWNTKSFYKKELTEQEYDSLVKLIRAIKKDKSHITIKVVQAENLLRIVMRYGSRVLEKKSFGIDYYQQLLGKSVVIGRNELQNILYMLPPSFFIPTLTIKNKDKKDDPIEISKVSSGERQLLYTLSTYVYHIRNLLSIPKKRVAYRHINLILDEAEICFHPEYQRLFLSRLLYMIKSLHLNKYCAFNIILATHSPFILSDMPRENILYLDNGKAQDRENFIRPLAANISDILYQSFFLRNGFIGEVARTKINEILKKIVSWNQLSVEETDFIENIGDEYLKKQIKRHFKCEER